MARRYTIETKIHALNQLDQYDGDMLRISKELTIPVSTLTTWRTKEADIRRNYRQKNQQQVTHLKSELQVQMFDMSQNILKYMDDDTLSKAPLNQLASAIGSLVNHALKLEEAIEETDEQEEKIVRFEYFYDGKVQDAPPWAGASEGLPRKVQGSCVRETLGEDGAGQDSTIGERDSKSDAWVVASTNLPDVQSPLDGIEDEYQERDWYHD